MSLTTAAATDVPYHLRAARLKWAAFAVTLGDDELKWVNGILANASSPPHAKAMAKLLISLHEREEISKVCDELHISRRRLRDLADKMTTKEGRRLLLSQPLPSKARPRTREI